MTDETSGLPDCRPPAPRPCKSCPYRLDVPAQVWHPEEYQRLPGYDLPTGEQPPGVFRCHQHPPEDPVSRVCAGWAHTHGKRPGHELLALRLAVFAGLFTAEQAEAIADYTTDVPCFASGAAAAHHGITGPYTEASALMAAGIVRHRSQRVRWRRSRAQTDTGPGWCGKAERHAPHPAARPTCNGFGQSAGGGT